MRKQETPAHSGKALVRCVQPGQSGRNAPNASQAGNAADGSAVNETDKAGSLLATSLGSPQVERVGEDNITKNAFRVVVRKIDRGIDLEIARDVPGKSNGR